MSDLGSVFQIARRRAATPKVASTVLLLGVVSMLTDVSSEMVSSILPLYIVVGLGLSPALFGVIDGLYQGSSALVRIASGVLADRSSRHKEVAVAGYGLSAVAKAALLAAGSSAVGVAASIFVDRTGKGIRTAPRDALIVLSTAPSQLGRAFGVHRAMDTLGALTGPLLAFLILALAPGAYRTVIFVSLVIAVLGVLVLVLFVESHEGRVLEETERPSLQASIRLLRGKQFRRVTTVGSLLAVLTISDAFIYLGLQRRLDMDPRLIPLLFVGTALGFMLLAAPIGRIADRIGRWRVFVSGHLLLLLVYGMLAAAKDGNLVIFACLFLLGAYYACTDGVLMALASPHLPRDLMASGLAIVTTATSIAKLLSSLVFGVLWVAIGLQEAVMVYGVGLAVMLLAMSIMLAKDVSPARST